MNWWRSEIFVHGILCRPSPVKMLMSLHTKCIDQPRRLCKTAATLHGKRCRKWRRTAGDWQRIHRPEKICNIDILGDWKPPVWMFENWRKTEQKELIMYELVTQCYRKHNSSGRQELSPRKNNCMGKLKWKKCTTMVFGKDDWEKAGRWTPGRTEALPRKKKIYIGKGTNITQKLVSLLIYHWIRHWNRLSKSDEIFLMITGPKCGMVKKKWKHCSEWKKNKSCTRRSVTFLVETKVTASDKVV